jgi:hypothetical protein
MRTTGGLAVRSITNSSAPCSEARFCASATIMSPKSVPSRSMTRIVSPRFASPPGNPESRCMCRTDILQHPIGRDIGLHARTVFSAFFPVQKYLHRDRGEYWKCQTHLEISCRLSCLIPNPNCLNRSGKSCAFTTTHTAPRRPPCNGSDVIWPFIEAVRHVARKFGRRGLRRPAGAVARGTKGPPRETFGSLRGTLPH